MCYNTQLLLLSLLSTAVHARIYHHTWAVEINLPGSPQQLAQQHGMEYVRHITGNNHLFRDVQVTQRSLEHSDHVTDRLVKHPHVRSAKQQTILSRKKRSSLRQTEFSFNDDYFPKQWYLYEDYNNVTGAWHQGVTGRGIVVTILDDGLERNHPDLEANYESHASTDLNDHDDDPMPRYDRTNENKHGTRCAGEVASVADNEKCGVGAAYHSSIGGIRMLDGDVTDAVEASALGFNQDFIDIYSASWGPDDDGRTVDGPGSLTVTSFTKGITTGRSGRGSIFVWASGNGGIAKDNCNCDGYTNSIWTLSIGSTSEFGEKPWYSEECSSTLAVTYSSGSGREKQILSTDLRNECTDRHTGTSAAAPLAAGIFALVLQANPLLGWRDMQHLVVHTSKQRNIQEGDWARNAAGRDVSHKFGYGVIDAGGLVELAQRWNNVPEQITCEADEQEPQIDIGSTQEEVLEQTVDGCQGTLRFLEHVQCVITVQADIRGNVVLSLESPSGTLSTLLTARRMDHSTKGFYKWPFLSVHYWGENPAGTWKLRVHNNGAGKMKLYSWQLVLRGTSTFPDLRDSPKPIPSSWRNTSVDCHRTCEQSAGCTGPGPADCGMCASYFQKSTGDCVDMCGPGEYLDRKGAVCIAHCGVGEYVNDGGQCRACEPSCAACSGPTLHNCTKCVEGRFLQPIDQTCVAECPANTVTQHGKCASCHADCLTCTDVGYDRCLTCKESLYFLSNRCYQTCPEGYYGHAQTSTCVRCAQGCATCFGTQSDKCTSCSQNLFLANYKCVEACPPSYYSVGDTRDCRRCHYTCETCTGDTINQCSSCIHGLFLSEGRCINPCGPGYRGDPATGTCVSCPEHCSKCSLQDTCTDCTDGFRLEEDTCITACPSGKYPIGEECKSCPKGCTSCSSPGECHSCSYNRILYQAQCLVNCPVAMFKRGSECIPCDPSCTACDANSVCSECADGFALRAGACVNPCGGGKYSDPEGGCAPCSGNCEACFGGAPTQCTACTDPSVQSLTDKYGISGQIFCSGCSDKCELCSQPYSNFCLSCHSGSFLLADTSREGRASCVRSCPSNMYKSDDNGIGKCGRCSSSCDTCSDSSTCSSCPSTMVLDAGVCRDDCPDSFYPLDGACVQCDNTCRTCRGGGPGDCLTCPPAYLHQDHVCVERCAPGYFQHEDACELCHATCTECSGPGEGQCSKCVPGFTLDESRCASSCEKGLYSDRELNICRPCHVSCENCTAGGSSSCLSCKHPLVMNLATEECRPCCSAATTDHCCYCDDSFICTGHVTAPKSAPRARASTETARVVVALVVLTALLVGAVYLLYRWRMRQRPVVYTLLEDEDELVTRGRHVTRGRVNGAYRDTFQEDIVSVVAS